MKRSEIREFVEGYLRLRGASVEALGRDVLRVREADRAPEARRGPRLLAFGPRAQRAHPGSELMAAGAASLDRLVAEAVRGGRFARSFSPVRAGAGRQPSVKGLPQIAGIEWGKPRPALRPLFLFVYRSEYHTIDVPDDLELIPIDPAAGEVLPSPKPLVAALRDGCDAPPRGWEVLPALPRVRDFILSLEALDRRLQHRAGRVKEASAIEIARETANIEAYYRQLIDEARRPVGRGQLSPEETAERVRALQLDWKRRVLEVSRFWEAYGDVRLSALGAIMVPCWAISAGRRGAGRSRGGLWPHAVAAFPGGRAVEPRCATCGEKLGARAALAEDELICDTHPRADDAPETGDE